MPNFKTSHGNVQVANWGYQLQGLNGAPLNPAPYTASPHDMLVIDYSANGRDAGAFPAATINAFKHKPGGGLALAYVSIGEASDFKDDWNPAWTTTGISTGALTAQAPHWLGPVDPDWPESRKVRYWEAGWQHEIFNAQHTGALDKIVAQGFDAAYLDIVDAYYFWAVLATPAERKPGDPAAGNEHDAANRMIDFITGLTAHARETNPNFFVIPQNGALIIDALADLEPARKAAFLNAIGGIACEDVYLRGGTADENNAFLPDPEVITALKRDFLAHGKPVFVVDYATDVNLAGQFVERALADGFIPTVALSRQLDHQSFATVRPAGTTEGTELVAGTKLADVEHGKGGNDWLYGFAGNDWIFGDAGNDTLSGGAGQDQLLGGTGADRLFGGAGRDILTGGADKDTFVFQSIADTRSGAQIDVITDFQRLADKIDLSGIDANSKTPGHQAFVWIGAQGFHGQAGELRFHDAGVHGYVESDTNGDRIAGFKILVLNAAALEKADFVL